LSLYKRVEFTPNWKGKAAAGFQICSLEIQTVNTSNPANNRQHHRSLVQCPGFLSRITKDGRIAIPKLAIALFKDGKPNLDNHVSEVRKTTIVNVIT
jgi:hypothetical protein